MSRETLLAYFEAIEQQLLALPNLYFRYDSTDKK